MGKSMNRRQSSASRQSSRKSVKSYTFDLFTNPKSGPFLKTDQGTRGSNGEFINQGPRGNHTAELDAWLARADLIRERYDEIAAHLAYDKEDPIEAVPPAGTTSQMLKLMKVLGIPASSVNLAMLAGSDADEEDEDEYDGALFQVGQEVQCDTKAWPYEVIEYDEETDVILIKRLPWRKQPAGQRCVKIENASERISDW
jgi:hypothetical protein